MRYLRITVLCTDAEAGPLIADLAGSARQFEINVVEPVEPAKGRRKQKLASNGTTGKIMAALGKKSPLSVDELVVNTKLTRSQIHNATHRLRAQKRIRADAQGRSVLIKKKG